MVPNWSQNGSKMVQHRTQRVPQIAWDGLWIPVGNPTRFQKKIQQKNSAHFGPKIERKLVQNLFYNEFYDDPTMHTLSRPIFERFLSYFEVVLSIFLIDIVSETKATISLDCK